MSCTHIYTQICHAHTYTRSRQASAHTIATLASHVSERAIVLACFLVYIIICYVLRCLVCLFIYYYTCILVNYIYGDFAEGQDDAGACQLVMHVMTVILLDHACIYLATSQTQQPAYIDSFICLLLINAKTMGNALSICSTTYVDVVPQRSYASHS